MWNQGAGESADASAHREKTSPSSQRSAKKCVSSPRSLLQSARTVCPLHRLDPRRPKRGSCPKLSRHRQDRRLNRTTCRPSLTAAARQAPPLQKVYHRDHRCRDGEHVRESAAAKRSDTSPVRQSQIHESPVNVNLHDKHSGRRAHQGGSLGKARLADAVKKQTERPQAGRARREKIRHPPVFSKDPLLGGWGVLLTCLEDLGKRSQLPPRLLHQRAIGALAQCRAWRRISIASSRCRQRQRRADSVIEALILGGLERTVNFDASCTKRQIPGCARLLAAQAARIL